MKIIKVVEILSLVLMTSAVASAKYITIKVSYGSQGEVIEVGSNEVLILDTYTGEGPCELWELVETGEDSLVHPWFEWDKVGIKYAGPIKLYVKPRDGWWEGIFAYVTFQLISNDSSGVPRVTSDAVVIPADHGGEFTILLESSQDLITWNQAMPGDYSGSTEQRFFRVRAVRK